MRKFIKNRLSIIIPTYNEENNITALTSEIIDLMQDKDYEILIVDDGSTDSTVKNILIKTIKSSQNRHFYFRKNC